MTRIATAFRRARSENRAAFIAYLTAGDPSANATVALPTTGRTSVENPKSGCELRVSQPRITKRTTDAAADR